MKRALWYRNRFEVLKHAASVAPGEGLILEFGVATGSTIRLLAQALFPRPIYGFDSFEGLPASWADYDRGHFACDPPIVPSNVELVVGMFADTVPGFLAQHAGDVALLHLDADLYSSTRLILHELDARIVPGTVIALDEYWIVQDEERRAFDEWSRDRDRGYMLEARAYEQALMVMT